MRRTLSFLLCLSLLALIILPAFAEDEGRYGREKGTPGYVKSITKIADGYVLRGPAEVYGVTVLMTEASATAKVYLYDDASVAATSAKIMQSQTTSGGTNRQVYNPPVVFKNDIYVDVSNAYVTVEYR